MTERRFPPMSRLTPKVWLGNCFDASCHDYLRHRGITAVANLTSTEFGSAEAGFIYFQADQEDSEDVPPEKIAAFLRWMDERMAAGDGVLIHCHAGISRTAAFTIAWLMHLKGAHGGMDLRTLWSRMEDMVGRVRDIIQPHYKLKASVLRYFEAKPDPTG